MSHRLTPTYRKETMSRSSVGQGFGLGLGLVLAFALTGVFVLFAGCTGCLFLATGGFSKQGNDQFREQMELDLVNAKIDEANLDRPLDKQQPHMSLRDLRELKAGKKTITEQDELDLVNAEIDKKNLNRPLDRQISHITVQRLRELKAAKEEMDKQTEAKR